MSAQPAMVDAQELTMTRDCTVPGCDGVDAGILGPYKGKCERHCEELRQRQREAQLNRSEPTGSLEQAARALVALGRKADRAQAKATRAVQEARAVKGDFDTAKQAFQQLARELAGG